MNRPRFLEHNGWSMSVYLLVFLSAIGVLAFSVSLAQEKAGTQKEHTHHAEGSQAMKLSIPQSLKSEHEELHAELAKAIGMGGQTGSAARIVADLLHPHFIKEEEYALPPLGLLPLLAKGEAPVEPEKILAMTNKLKAEMPLMLQEHRNIVTALKGLSDAARREGKTEAVRFAEKLMQHAQNEEEILYPASMLVGEYLRLKLGR